MGPHYISIQAYNVLKFTPSITLSFKTVFNAFHFAILIHIYNGFPSFSPHHPLLLCALICLLPQQAVPPLQSCLIIIIRSTFCK
jgi:hypothetical protein